MMTMFMMTIFTLDHLNLMLELKALTHCACKRLKTLQSVPVLWHYLTEGGENSKA